MEQHLQTGSPRILLTGLPHGPSQVAFNRAGTLVAAADPPNANHAIILAIDDGREIARLESVGRSNIFCFVGDELVLTTRDEWPVLHDIRRGVTTPLNDDSLQGAYSAVCDPTGRLIAFGAGRGLAVYDLVAQSVRLRTKTILQGRSESLAFTADGRHVGGPFVNRDRGGAVLVWEVATGKRVRTYEVDETGDASYECALAFNGDSLSVAVGSERVHLFDADRGEEPVAIHGKVFSLIRAMAFREAGAVLATLGWSGGLVLLDVATGRATNLGAPVEVEGCAPSPDWSLVAGCVEKGIALWPTGLA